MGRYELGPQRVHKMTTRLLEAGKLNAPPPWYAVLGDHPPAERLVRPALQVRRQSKKKASRLFQPIKIEYPEDKLREDFYGDHPWELARPRTLVENDGKDYQRQNTSRIVSGGRPVSGESVVQRQMYLMQEKGLSKLEAYDIARKEFYKAREGEEIRSRVALEEAQYSGARFGLSALETGLMLEDQTFETWKAWAAKEVEVAKQTAGSSYTPGPAEMDGEDAADGADGLDEADGGDALADGNGAPGSEVV